MEDSENYVEKSNETMSDLSSMPSEMVQRVAHELRHECSLIFGTSWSNDTAWRLATRAIVAMREPTQAMLDAAEELNLMGGISDCGACEPDVYNIEDVWPAMIDGALK